MAAPAFDTLRFVRTLRDKAKPANEQAEGFAYAIGEAVQGDLSTKSDVIALQTSIESVRADLRQTELRLEAKIEMVKADLMRCVVGAVGFQTVVILGALIAILRFARP